MPLFLFPWRIAVANVDADLRNLEARASFADLHDLAPELSGSARMELFQALSTDTQRILWASLRASQERKLQK
jgi:hypothetical protein